MEVTLKDLRGEAELQIVAGRHLGFGFLIFLVVSFEAVEIGWKNTSSASDTNLS